MAQSPQPSHEWRPDRPYNQLPGLPPAADLETPAVLRQCIPARAALGELKQAANLIPNPAVLINIIPLLEAQASSEIENIVTTTDELFRHQQADDGAAPATKEALRYSQALLEGFQIADRTATHHQNSRAGLQQDQGRGDADPPNAGNHAGDGNRTGDLHAPRWRGPVAIAASELGAIHASGKRN